MFGRAADTQCQDPLNHWGFRNGDTGILLTLSSFISFTTLIKRNTLSRAIGLPRDTVCVGKAEEMLESPSISPSSK